MNIDFCIFIITLVATAGVIIRPYKIQEAYWAVGGALVLVLFGLITIKDAWTGVSKGLDVYLFLMGMMILSESAQREGLFNWLASYAIRLASGSAIRLFILVYLIGLLVTIFMSNDATAVVLTPAVAVATAKAKVKKPLPYLLICAFIANAASFVLPISNPANLVIYGSEMPSLKEWVNIYALPSLFSITITFIVLFITQKKKLIQERIAYQEYLPLQRGAKLALAGILSTTVLLLTSLFLHWNLGFPTAAAGVGTALIILLIEKRNASAFIRHISWSIVPLVAGLFVLVEAVQHTGIIIVLLQKLSVTATDSPVKATWMAGTITALSSNLINNLPAGLIAGTSLAGSHLPDTVQSATLIGVDLGPNLSITGSLATILWLKEIRKNGYEISSWQFLKLGFLIMIPALLAALSVVIFQSL
ncbi:arsenic transporter [Chryseobacterium sp. G0162]|uniref:arsenic transporter n=1 Tax=Chryseobacterium sp. G0162 TaxID=2487063 RepID=UPI000F50F14B|nr:arsenic transporter [Chryseobacterium sp. G0162]AZB07352.1 arsenic transporter [Chryseobacterium sp. G0162]